MYVYYNESDNSIPAASVHYQDLVRQIMYPVFSLTAGTAATIIWYRLYIIPGAAHCSPNTLQPNGPFPQTNLQVLLNWVEKGVEPTTLNATCLAGTEKGKNS
ncbi:hypothetical protein BJ878DRAFT_285665 [Calycina marina]|uniref:Carboxylic ester hydrolase n=1 Tax=Calycina marina TaxID=1763456 RepID=A0A9P8CB11_9HELO|nr:hypothetical protein BJ878DRAFT_285665 [Calycina marina]